MRRTHSQHPKHPALLVSGCLLAGGFLFWLFPHVETCTAACSVCGAQNVFIRELSPIVSPARHHESITPAKTSVSTGHQHVWEDMTGGDYRNIPRWKLQ
ncbi:MAG: hypothetical protein V4726_19680 [Verrucomicrobiota bacterium]